MRLTKTSLQRGLKLSFDNTARSLWSTSISPPCWRHSGLWRQREGCSICWHTDPSQLWDIRTHGWLGRTLDPIGCSHWNESGLPLFFKDAGLSTIFHQKASILIRKDKLEWDLLFRIPWLMFPGFPIWSYFGQFWRPLMAFIQAGFDYFCLLRMSSGLHRFALQSIIYPTPGIST